MSIGWANDAVDAARDRAAERTDKPIAIGAIRAGVVEACAVVALIVDIPLSLAVGWRPGAAHLVAVGSAWLYDLRLKETVASWLPYAVSFALLPVIVATTLRGHPLPQPAIVAVAGVLGVGAHFANTVGDVAEDARTGVRGLPQRIGPRASLVVAAAAVADAGVLLVWATRGAPATLAAAIVACAAVPVTLRSRHRQAPFLAVIAAAGLLIVAFISAGGDHLTAR